MLVWLCEREKQFLATWLFVRYYDIVSCEQPLVLLEMNLDYVQNYYCIAMTDL